MPAAQVGSHTFFYDDLGSGLPLLLLTGLGGNRFSWWKQLVPFMAKYRVINMDNRDSGDSALVAEQYTIADMANDVAGVIQNLKLGPTNLVGISLGGLISMELAIRHPELVKKLILVSAHTGLKSFIPPQPEILGLLGRNEPEDLEARYRRIYPMFTGKGYMSAQPEDLDQIVNYAKAKPMLVESYQRQLGAAMVYDALGRLDKISVPTLVIHGEDDPLVPYANGQYLAEHIKGARLSTYPCVGHLPPIEAAERFNREVIEFLGQ